MSNIIFGDYKNWTGEQLFPSKSSFTTRGYEIDFKQWKIDDEKKPDEDKLLFNLWMIEYSPNHPPVMGKMEVYDGINFVYVNPFFQEEEKEEIYNELRKAAGAQMLNEYKN